MNNSLCSFWRPVQIFSSFVAAAATALAAAAPQTPASPPEKPRLAIRSIAATASVTKQAAADGTANSLAQIEEGADVQLLSAIEATKRFQLVARADLPSVLKEQDLTQSGNANTLDPQAARGFQLAGARYVATVTLSNYQEIIERTDLLNQFGTSKAERRTINLQAVVKIFDTTSGVLFRVTQVNLAESSTNEILPGVEQKGSKTNVLLGAVTKKLATDAANAIADSLAPARVIGYTLGQITMNRSSESGVAAGQIYEVFVPGSAMIDPDTGEALGAEEIHVGWARVTDAGSRFSTAQAIEDRGIDRGAMLRLRAQGLPVGVNPEARANGSASGTNAAAAGTAPTAAPAATTPAPGGTATPTAADPTARKVGAPMRLAIFVKQRPVSIPPEKVPVFEDLISADTTSSAVEIIRREDVLNAVNRFAAAGANAGTNTINSEEFDRLMSNRSTATGLAGQMKADAILTASITALQKANRKLDDPSTGVSTDVEQWTLYTTYAIIDGVTGASLGAGSVQSDFAKRNTKELKVEIDVIDPLLADAAQRISSAVRATIDSGRMRAMTPASEVAVKIQAVLTDLSIPDVRTDTSGQYIVGANNYDLQPMNVQITMDGVFLGAAPGAFTMRAGLHRMVFSRPGLESVEMMINAREGLEVSVSMQFSPEGREVWRRDAAFFNELKNGAVLRDAELIRVRGFADFLKQSNIRLDTTNTQNLNIGGESWWLQLLK